MLLGLLEFPEQLVKSLGVVTGVDVLVEVGVGVGTDVSFIFTSIF